MPSLPSVRVPFVFVLLAGSLITSPAPADPPTPDALIYLETAATEIDALEDLALGVYDPTLRRAMFTHVRNAEMAVHRARYELEYGGYDGGWEPRPSMLSYDDARRVVMRESFDSGRLEAIRRVARVGRYSTEQAAGLADMCTFDSYKREALIALYPSVTDPARYMLALDVLDFDSSRRDVEDALGL